ncbi:MAG TPA: WYL domain-containing protein, partial [bacterium]|nr:WYL domain-containing protein [bacterium]
MLDKSVRIRNHLKSKSGLRSPMILRLRRPSNRAVLEALNMDYGDKITRVLNLIQDLAARQHTKKELAEKYGVTERTILRDLDTIRRAGYELDEGTPFESGIEKRYRLERRKPADQVCLTQDESILLAYCVALAAREVLPRNKTLLESVSDKIERYFPPDFSQQMRRVGCLYVPLNRFRPNVEFKRDELGFLESGIVEQVWVGFRYQKSDGTSNDYVVAPFAILSNAGRLYLYGWIDKHVDGEPALFDVSRIENVEILDDESDKAVKIPFPDKEIKPDEIIGSSFGLWRDGPFDVEIIFSDDAAKSVQRNTFHPSQKIEMLEGN